MMHSLLGIGTFGVILLDDFHLALIDLHLLLHFRLVSLQVVRLSVELLLDAFLELNHPLLALHLDFLQGALRR